MRAQTAKYKTTMMSHTFPFPALAQGFWLNTLLPARMVLLGKRQVILGLSLALALLVDCGNGFSCNDYANGCTAPNVPYKTLFTPACILHDVCYRCGARYRISRYRCDSAFYSNMHASCSSRLCVQAAGGFLNAVRTFGGLFYHNRSPPDCNDRRVRSLCLPH